MDIICTIRRGYIVNFRSSLADLGSKLNAKQVTYHMPCIAIFICHFCTGVELRYDGCVLAYRPTPEQETIETWLLLCKSWVIHAGTKILMILLEYRIFIMEFQTSTSVEGIPSGWLHDGFDEFNIELSGQTSKSLPSSHYSQHVLKEGQCIRTLHGIRYGTARKNDWKLAISFSMLSKFAVIREQLPIFKSRELKYQQRSDRACDWCIL